LVFIPLVLIALYVNQITTFTKETFKPFILGDKETTDKVEEKEVPEDIEEESVKDEDDDDSDDDDGSTKANDSDAIYHITLDAAPEEESPYAPIFGKWKFHTYIPILRKLWERQVYLNTFDDDTDYLFDQAVEKDYPLHHYLSKISLWNILPSRISEWWIEREWQKHRSDSDDSSPVGGRREPRRRIIVEKVRVNRHRHRIRKRSSNSDDDVEVIEEYSDLPRFRASGLFGPVQRLFRRWVRGHRGRRSTIPN
jgi:hypothetical protein